jgi:hypothetical protein
MARTIYYRQCILRKGNATTTSWLPEPFAVLGKVLRLRDDAGTWDNGWVVAAVHERREESQLPDAHMAIRGHRKRTGDALPREKGQRV